MTLAVILVVAAALSLIYILALTVSRKMQVFAKPRLNAQLQPIDVEAFRNLIDPAEDDYLRRRLPAAEFRTVRRERLLATAAYVKAAGRNAAFLVHLGQSALNSSDVSTAEAARQLVNDALLLRRNAAFALLKIYIVLVWPNSGLFAEPVLVGYERMSGSAMLLGRLRNPSAPVRV
jgi:hypothetical protein